MLRLYGERWEGIMALYKNTYRIESARLRGWDYRWAGCYFVTLCTRDHQPFFGVVRDGQVRLSPIGEIAQRCWLAIPEHTHGLALDAWVVMPNHVHGLLVLGGQAEADHEEAHPSAVAPLKRACPPGNPSAGGGDAGEDEPTERTASRSMGDASSMAAIAPGVGSLGVIVRVYKAAVARWCRQNGHPAFAWQGRFHDRIIRNDRELWATQAYIENNPAQWAQDKYCHGVLGEAL